MPPSPIRGRDSAGREMGRKSVKKLSLSVILGLLAAFFSAGQASAATTVVVGTNNTDGWHPRLTDDTGATDPSSDGYVKFRNGPGSPPLGTGSVELSTGTDGSGSAEIRNTEYDGTALADL